MKFHGLHQPASSLRETLKPAASADESKPADPTSPGKKASENRPKSYTSPNKRARKSFKGYDGENCNLAVDDDEELVHTSAEKIKTETTSPSVKEEPQAEYQGMTGFQYPMAQEGAGTTAVGSADMPGDYLQPGDFEAHLGSYNHTFDGLEDVFPDIEGGLSGTWGAMAGN